MDKSEFTYHVGCHDKCIHGSLPSKRLKDFFKIEDTSLFVETGTYHGDGVKWALEQPNFEKILSTEIYEPNFLFCIERFKNVNKIDYDVSQKINISLKDTINFLSEKIPHIKQPTLFFLDAHGGSTDFGQNNNHIVPIVQEISIILKHFYNFNDLMIVIDDERLFGTEKPNAWNINDYITIKHLCSVKELVSIYIDDSIVFCRQKWLRQTVDC